MKDLNIIIHHLWANLKCNQVRDILRNTCDQKKGVDHSDKCHNRHYGFGWINADKAVRQADYFNEKKSQIVSFNDVTWGEIIVCIGFEIDKNKW